MKTLLSLLAIAAMVASHAAPAPPLPHHSQQFVVFDLRPKPNTTPRVLKPEAGQELIQLSPEFLLLSAERIKEALLRELNVSPGGCGKIQLTLHAAARPDELIGIHAGFHTDGWQYQVGIPDQIERQKLVRGILHVLLLEIANRGQGSKSAELPLWLVEGITFHLWSISGPDLIVGSVPVGSMLRVTRERRGLDYLKEAREYLRASPRLSFADLGYPSAEHLRGGRLKAYQYSAQLFVAELLRLKNGAAGLVAMLRALPNYWNWETAFLRAFHADFQRMLDLEKWWAVNLLAFTSYDPSQVWSRVVALDKLDQVLSVTAQVRLATDALPQRRVLSLQQVIAEWDGASQAAVLRQKLPELTILRFNCPREIVALIDGYYQALVDYLQKRTQAGRAPETRMQTLLSASLVAQDTIKELERLDQRRKALQPEQMLSIHSPISP